MQMHFNLNLSRWISNNKNILNIEMYLICYFYGVSIYVTNAYTTEPHSQHILTQNYYVDLKKIAFSRKFTLFFSIFIVEISRI